MFIKMNTVNTNIYNNLSQSWFISYMMEGNNTIADSIVNNFNYVNAFDAYSSLLYVWGARDVRINNSHLIGAGGPVMIVDHVENNATTGEGGYISNVKTTDSTLESYVAGTEGWFNTYEGSGAIVTSLKGMDALLNAYGKTILDSTGKLINLISVYKSGSVEGLSTSKIRGTFSDTDYTYGLDLSSATIETIKNNIITALASQGYDQATIASILEKMAILQTYNGTVGVPGTSGWFDESVAPNSELMATAEAYLNVYLFNGMAAVIGLNNYTAA